MGNGHDPGGAAYLEEAVLYAYQLGARDALLMIRRGDLNVEHDTRAILEATRGLLAPEGER